MDEKLKEEKVAGPFVKVDGKATDAGLYDHVFDGTDDAYDEMLRLKELQKQLRLEMRRRGILPKTFEETLRQFASGL